ncbi:beta-ketoacyl synthase N-terminal-like domain-containing protein [Bacillus solimangrovi]|uniref:Ketosynthase family 3 (KS3) domain-containing protein n=1 Tax=Bacillus solimangrovi TaxID=1305675 RepID=A0A1E5LJ19_9BACI|nr:beta-ketoacyl synthase N-terminal-like domain-containing protein [Bacillus solimangrovi]OEH94074.1 hypothetical protein BFG57_09510 [Bacillus solimangrovi]
MERISVTGFGIKAPNATNIDQFRCILERGNNALNYVEHPTIGQIVCGVVRETFEEVDGVKFKKYPRIVRMAISASYDAFSMSRIKNKKNSKKIAVIVGSSNGAAIEIEKHVLISKEKSYNRFPPTAIAKMNANSIVSGITSFLGLNGMSLLITNSCTSSLDAINVAKSLLETKQADACIVCGIDSSLTDIAFYGFSKIGITHRNSEISNGGPFSGKDYFAMAEGAGAVILERESDVLQEDREIFGFINNVASNQDGLSIYHSDLSGKWMNEAARQVLNGKQPDFVNSQALGLEENDQIEKQLFQDLINDDVPISSIKGLFGHPFGAAGMLQCVSSLLSMNYGFISPVTNTIGKDYLHLPIVRKTKYQKVDNVLITNHGYGGNNACLFMSKT